MNKVETKLSCGHVIRQTVNSPSAYEGEQAYCRFDGWQEVIEVYEHEWRVICADCQHGAWCGQDKRKAWRDANMHSYMKNGHRTFVKRDRVTPSGGTPRKKFLSEQLSKAMGSDTVLPTRAELPPPF